MADGRTNLGVDVLDELVEILEPFIGILELEVAAHCHDSMICGVTDGLSKTCHGLRVNGIGITTTCVLVNLGTTSQSRSESFRKVNCAYLMMSCFDKRANTFGNIEIA